MGRRKREAQCLPLRRLLLGRGSLLLEHNRSTEPTLVCQNVDFVGVGVGWREKPARMESSTGFPRTRKECLQRTSPRQSYQALGFAFTQGRLGSPNIAPPESCRQLSRTVDSGHNRPLIEMLQSKMSPNRVPSLPFSGMAHCT